MSCSKPALARTCTLLLHAFGLLLCLYFVLPTSSDLLAMGRQALFFFFVSGTLQYVSLLLDEGKQWEEVSIL